MSDLKQKVYAVMEELRPAVEDYIGEWMAARPSLRDRMKGLPVTTGLCRGINAGVQDVLQERFPDCRWSVTGGFGAEYSVDTPENLHEFADMSRFPGGMVDVAGSAWGGHFWVVGGHPDSGEVIIVDLAADQFGHEPIIVTEADDPRYCDNSLLGQEHMVRPSERAWGLQVYERWRTTQEEVVRHEPKRAIWI